MSEFEGVIKDFLVESHENVEQLDGDLVALEKAPGDRTILGRIFRTLHTIKGSCAFLGFRKLQAVAHAGESLLGKLRDGTRVVTEHTTSVLLAVVDAIREMLAAIEVHGNDGNREHSDLIQMLGLLADGKNPSESSPTSKPSPPSSSPPSTAEYASAAGAGFLPSGAVVAPAPRSARQSGRAAAPVHTPTSDTFVLTPDQQQLAEADSDVLLNTPGAAIDLNDVLDDFDSPMVVRPAPPVLRQPPGSPPVVAPAPAATPEPPAAGVSESAQAAASVFDNTVRLDVQLLDKLMLLVSELVLARNQIAQYVSTIDGTQAGRTGLVAAGRQLNLITSELQEQVMKTRLQPIANIWNRFPRLVRDLAVQCGKQVEIEMQGSETELDKTIIEAIRDPLTHMVRNAVDHGIESSFVREVDGKPAGGRLKLRAFHEGGQVNIEVSDDGAGIDPQKVKQRAIERGIISSQQVAALNDQALLNLVFLPGFSTAAGVTAVSGRGVGMDVVKTNIERIGGTVDIQSRLGHGTTIKLRIPLTLAIIKALIVTTGGHRYAIPQVSIVELVRLGGDKAGKAIERFQDAMVFRFRNRLLPVVELNRVLDVERTSVRSNETNGMNSVLRADSVNLAILQAGDKFFALVVDHVNDTQEIVVKPLWKQLKGIACLAGATIMADGRVALILDVFGLAQQASVLPRVRERELSEMKAAEAGPAEQRHGFVLVEDNARCRMAIPLEKVARLEKLSASAIERLGDQSVVQYRGEILPLVDVAGLLRKGAKVAGAPSGGSDLLHVVVYTHGGRSIGLIVNHILDIADQVLAVKSRATRDNVLFSTVIQGHVTEFLDVEGLIRAGDPGFFAGTAGVPAGV